MAKTTESSRVSAFRTPLAVLGGFVVVVESILAGTAGGSPLLTAGQRWFLIGAMPLLLGLTLLALYRLVTTHHRKLYAPFEFRSDKGFLQTMSEPEILRKAEAEIRAIEDAGTEDRPAETEPAPPEVHIPAMTADPMVSQNGDDVRNSYVRDERDLVTALRRLTRRQIRENVKVDDLYIDAIITSPHAARIVEFKVISDLGSAHKAADAGISQLPKAVLRVERKGLRLTFGSMLALVPDYAVRDAFVREASQLQRASNLPFRIHVDAITRDELRRLLTLTSEELESDPVAQRISIAMNESL